MTVDVLFDEDASASPPTPPRAARRGRLLAVAGVLVALLVLALAWPAPSRDVPGAALLAEVAAKVQVDPGEQPARLAVVDGRGAWAAVQVDERTVASGRVDQPLPLGSLSEMLTAATVLRLVEAGTLDLDASAAGYLDGADLPADVTLRHLLQHTSGLPDLAGDPGATVRWSSANEAVLRDVVATATGTDFAQVLDRQVLSPAGLGATTLEPAADGQTAEMTSTVADVAAFLRALHDGRLLSESTEAMLTDRLRDVTRSGAVQIGLGLVRFTGYGPLVGSFGVVGERSLLVMHDPQTGATAVWDAPASVDLRDTLRPVATYLSAG